MDSPLLSPSRRALSVPPILSPFARGRGAIARRRSVALAAGGALLLALARPIGAAQPSNPSIISAEPIVRDIGGIPVTITPSGRVRWSENPDGAAGALEITLDLADLQAKILKIVRAQANRGEFCGDRLDLDAAKLSPPVRPESSATSVSSVSSAIAAVLTVAGRYEWYFCRPPMGDLFNPGPPRLMFSEEGRARFELVPRIGEQGIGLDTNVLAVEAGGALGRVLDVRSLGEFLRRRLGVVLAQALSAESFWPAPLRDLPPGSFSPVNFERARFVDLGKGRLGLAVEGTMRLSREAFERWRTPAAR